MRNMTNFVHNDITYELEHNTRNYLEHLVVRTNDEEFIGDVFINHETKEARTEYRDGSCHDTSYQEVNNMTRDEITRWIIDRA